MKDLENRIKKNYEHLSKWAKRTNTNCFRIYDRDIKEFPISIDFYDGKFLINYFSFPQDDENKFYRIEEAVLTSLRVLFSVRDEDIFWKERFKRQMTEQYEKLDSQKAFFEVQEYGVKFKVNLVDYLDTGLFLDHREIRQMVAKFSQGKRLLNLFSYTCSFSVHAAIQGALSTTSVDLSNTYLNWGKDNFALNNISLDQNHFIREDCQRYVYETDETFDVIVIDPPTISRSKKMEQMFDIQKDHPSLLYDALNLLSENGVLFFSTNSRSFKMDDRISCEEITNKTIPWGFRNPHKSWKLTKASLSDSAF